MQGLPQVTDWRQIAQNARDRAAFRLSLLQQAKHEAFLAQAGLLEATSVVFVQCYREHAARLVGRPS